MKEERGITLATLIIYLALISAVIAALSILSSHVYDNAKDIGAENLTSEEFNKFNVNFIKSVKNNKTAVIEKKPDPDVEGRNGDIIITFEDTTVYSYVLRERAIYKNKIKIAKNINEFDVFENTINNKKVLKVKIGTGRQNYESSEFGKTINYVLKYW